MPSSNWLLISLSSNAESHTTSVELMFIRVWDDEEYIIDPIWAKLSLKIELVMFIAWAFKTLKAPPLRIEFY